MAKVYEYRCKACGDVETYSKNDITPYECQCGKGKKKRVYSLAGIGFKGSGFYHVDKRKTDGGKIGID